MIETRITKLLGIKYPVIQGAMNYISLPPLAAAVSNAGGLGILCLMALTPEEARGSIREVKRLTEKPFAVNIVRTSPYYRAYLEVILEEGVPVLSHGVGNPFLSLGMSKPPEITFIPTVGTVKQAVVAEQLGADAVIAQGFEAGGHVGRIANTVLIPKVAESVKIPVVAAGGFCDGRGLVAALSLGAEGISLGTRFALTVESALHAQAKEALIRASESEAVITVRHDGWRLRALIGKRVRHYRGWWSRPWEVLPSFVRARKEAKLSWGELLHAFRQMRADRVPGIQWIVGNTKIVRATAEGDVEGGLVPGGQVAGRIDRILTCQEVMEGIIVQAEELLQRLRDRLD